MTELNEHVIIITKGTHQFVYRSFSRFCKDVGVDRKKYPVVPENVFTEKYGWFNVKKLPMNIGLDANMLRAFITEKHIQENLIGSVRLSQRQKEYMIFDNDTVAYNGIEIKVDERTLKIVKDKIKK